MEKVLSVVIPCYNSAAYMEHAVESLLPAGEDLDIMIVDDGSEKDNTLEIAERLQAAYPGIVRAIHEENKGHGGAVNTGMENARGLFFKVLDSDDWLDSEVLLKVVAFLKALPEEHRDLDMLVTNTLYDKQGAKHKHEMKYRGLLPTGRFFGWEDIGFFQQGQMLLMHCVIYRTALLREIGLRIPEHSFYVDNLYVYTPLPHIRKMYYMDALLYHYFIGRADQSVNFDVISSRITEQFSVNRKMLDACDIEAFESARMKRLLYVELESVTMVSEYLAVCRDDEVARKLREEFWAYFAETRPEMCKKVRNGAPFRLLRIPGKTARKIEAAVYTLIEKFFGFT